jgi:hypothetical protein
VLDLTDRTTWKKCILFFGSIKNRNEFNFAFVPNFNLQITRSLKNQVLVLTKFDHSITPFLCFQILQNRSNRIASLIERMRVQQFPLQDFNCGCFSQRIGSNAWDRKQKNENRLVDLVGFFCWVGFWWHFWWFLNWKSVVCFWQLKNAEFVEIKLIFMLNILSFLRQDLFFRHKYVLVISYMPELAGQFLKKLV